MHNMRTNVLICNVQLEILLLEDLTLKYNYLQFVQQNNTGLSVTLTVDMICGTLMYFTKK